MENLTSYLNDHLAGSIGALELLERAVKQHDRVEAHRPWIAREVFKSS